MERRGLLWFVALAFSVVLLVQYIELPYGYVVSSLLSIGKSEVALVGSLSTNGLSNETGNSAHRIVSGGSSAADAFQNVTKFLEEKKPDERSSTEFLELNHSTADDIVVRGHVHDLPVSSYTSARNSSVDSLRGTNVVSSSIIDEERDSRISSLPSHASPPQQHKGSNQSTHILKDPADTVQKRPSLTQSQFSTYVNNSSSRRTPKLTRFKGPPAVVVPISEMNDLMRKSYGSYRSMKPRWPSQADVELLNAKKLIESADSVEKNTPVDVHVYRNFSAFTRSYELMEQTLKIYIYSEGERPIFHQPELNGIYASEGWFMKQLEQNKNFVTTDANKAHLFYLPFSSHILQEVLYVPDSHSRKNLVRYLSSYLHNITSTYRFWDRTNGADHFLVACHDWAPAETGRIMNNCIRALCNANVKGGFQFGKDVSLPETYVRNATSPLKSLGGKPPSQRHILAFFAGKMHGYLRPILLNYWENKDPDMKISGKLQKSKDEMSYIQYMKSSKYCISARGYEAYTPRVVEAIFYECVPVIIADNYIPPFFETLNWESFAVFIPEKDIPNLKNILASIPEKRYIEMQQRVRQVQKHFLWHDKAVKFDVFHMILHSLWHTRVVQIGA